MNSIPSNRHFDSIEKQTQAIYTRNGLAFDQQRPRRLHEKKWLDKLIDLIPPNGSVLDVGCGAGDPIAGYFIDQGFILTGVDFSKPMLKLAQERFPQSTWILQDMRALNLTSSFDGIIAWNSFFHLNPDDQRSTLARLANTLAPGGAMMLTVGPDAGEVIGHVNGEEVYHSSLATREYEEILHRSGIELKEFVAEDEECDYQTVLLAAKP